jgi:spoIIIJ-associated protein
MGSEASAEGTGLTLGEAKWSAVKQLARRFPGLTAEQVSFEVLAEGEVDGSDARVRAHADLEAWEAAGGAAPASDEPTERVRGLLEEIIAALDLKASVEVTEDDEAIHGTLAGPELGLFIGKHGQTIDAVQQLAVRIAFRGQQGERKRVVIDAAGYRERREAALRRQADQAADDALRFGRPVALDAMSALERKVVHEHLRDRGELQTYSEGEEPDRHLVVAPVGR